MKLINEKKYNNQLQKVYQILKEEPLTMKETDVKSGIMRESICRYISTLLKQGRIAITRKRKCTITGYPSVNEYTSNPDLFPMDNQLHLF